jgi:predicted TPR repeat methyltransferase
MTSYDIFGKFYDAVMGDRAQATEQLRKLIRKANPKARNVLELGCGTGSVLKQLSKHYEVWGLDLSKQMLSIARKKVPPPRLSRQNMVNFRLRQRFDVICCVFDSLNHVASFTEWKHLFDNVHRHLADEGVFIFDINTQKKLNRHIAEPAWVHKFGENILIMKVTKTNGGSNWTSRSLSARGEIDIYYMKRTFKRYLSRCVKSSALYGCVSPASKSLILTESGLRRNRRGCTSFAKSDGPPQ